MPPTQKSRAEADEWLKSWETEDSKDGYSPFNFYTSSQDKDGNSETYHIKLPKYLVPRLQELKEQFPAYRTVNDIFRDALRHRERFLADNYDGIRKTPEQQMLDDLEEAMTWEERLEYWKRLPGQIESLCRSFQECGDQYHLGLYIEDQRRKALEYRDPWKTKVFNVLDRYQGFTLE